MSLQVLLCAAMLQIAVGAPDFAVSKPDILLLMPDQMRGDCLSMLDHPVVRTPNLDALAKQGTLFRRAYSTVPSCIPARFALLTGLAPQSSGVVGFAAKPITTPTLPDLLGEAGYATVAGFHALTDGHQKYIWRPLDGTEYLFDLDHDPREERDLAKASAEREALERWRARLVQHLAARPEGFSDGTKLIPGRPYPALQSKILPK